jgi:hypothetical protein
MNDTNPSEILSNFDHGDDMQLRVRYQSTYGAMIALGMLLDTVEIEEVYCEQHEDLLLRRTDGTFCGCQLKTRHPKLGAFKTDDPQISDALARFVALDIQFTGKFARYIIATNVAFWQREKNSKNLPHMIELARLIQSGAVPTQSKEIRKIVRLLSEKHKCKRPQVWSVLARVELQSELPQFQDVEKQLAVKIAEVLDQPHRRLDELTRAARSLVQLVTNASSLNHTTPLARYFVFLQNPAAAEELAVIQGKKITKRQLLQAIHQAFESETLLASCQRISLSDLPKGATVLEKKLTVGGLSASDVTLLKDFKFSADKLLQEWMWKYGPEEAARRYDHMQLVVQEDCSEAHNRTISKTTVYGPAMLTRLRENVRTSARDVALKFAKMGVAHHHLLGVSGILTEECKVWWSERFNMAQGDSDVA